MKRFILFSCFYFGSIAAPAQSVVPLINVRLSFLLFPFSPLLTVECRTVGRLTIQGETNFVHTHGLNLKYYLNSPMERGYVFVGSAFVKNQLLRQDGGTTTLPYAGWGYAHILDKNWVIDGRIGLGPTLNADRNGVYPVIKIGAGKRF
jgi:hypothetical protein